MPETTEVPATEFLLRLVGSVRGALRRRAAIRAGLWACAAAFASWAALILLDAAVTFGPELRPWVYAAAFLGGAAACGAVAAAAWLRRPSVGYVARLIERRRPELRTSLITFLELASAGDEGPRDAVAARAARLLAESRAEDLAPAAPLRRPLVGGACAAVAFGAALWLAQGVVFRPWIRGAEAVPVAYEPAPTAVGRPPAAPAHADGVGSGEETGTPRGSVAEPRQDGAAETPSASATDTADMIAGQDPDAGDGGLEGSAAPALVRQLAQEVGRDRERFERLAAAMAGPQPTAPGAGGPGAEAGSRGGQARPRNPSREGQSGAATVSPPGLQGEGRASADGAAEPPNAGLAGAGDKGVTDDARGTAGGDVPGTGGGGVGPVSEPLPERPQPAEIPENALDAARWAERLIERADRKLRDGRTDEGFLRDMGMSPAEMQRFVTSWKRRFDAASAGGPIETPPAGAGRRTRHAEPGGVLHATGEAAARSLRDSGGHGSGDARAIQEETSRVSPHLRPCVEAYFEALSRAADEGRSHSP